MKRLFTSGDGAFHLQWYLRRNFFGPSGLGHWLPSGAPHEIDYSGTCPSWLEWVRAIGASQRDARCQGRHSHTLCCAGQSNDGYFRLAYQGKLNCIVDRVKRLEEKHAGTLAKDWSNLILSMWVNGNGSLNEGLSIQA